MLVEEIDIISLLKAFNKLEIFRVNHSNEQEKTGTIFAFLCCFELGWKIMRQLLEERGKIAFSPRETFKLAALEGLIEDPELWFDFLNKRNLTTKTYQESELETILSMLPKFSAEIRSFLSSIGTSLD